MEPVFPGSPINREEHYLRTVWFSGAIFIMFSQFVAFIHPLYNFDPEFIKSLFGSHFLYSAGGLVFGAIFGLALGRFLRVIYSKPGDEKITQTWITRTGKKLQGWRGIVALIMLLTIILGAWSVRIAFWKSVRNGEVVGLELDQPIYVRHLTIGYFENNPDVNIVPALVRIVEHKPVKNTGIQASLLHKFYSKCKAPTRGLLSPEEMVREKAYLLLEKMLDPRSVELLSIRLKYETDIKSSRTVFLSLEPLESLITAKAIEPFAVALTRNGDPHNRTVYMKALLRIGTPEAIDVITGALDMDNSPDISAAIVSALGDTGNKRMITPLTKVMNNSKDPWTRCFAAVSLGKIGRETRVIDALMNAWEFGDTKNLPHYAKDALRSIMPFPDFCGWISTSGESYSPWKSVEKARRIYEAKKHRYVWDNKENRFTILPEPPVNKDK